MKQTLSLLFALIFFGCSNYSQRKNEISKIEIATGGCFGPCQITVVSIDSTLSYKYYGGETYFTEPPNPSVKKLKGYYAKKISKGFWDTLNMKFEQINYKQLHNSYQNTIDDQSLEIFIQYNNEIKHIDAQSASLPDNVSQVFYYVINSYQFIKPRPTKDTFVFERAPRKLPRVTFPPQNTFPPPIKKK